MDELRERYLRIARRIEELSGQEVAVRLRTDSAGRDEASVYWSDGQPWSEVAQATSQALTELACADDPPVIVLRALSVQSRVETVIAAAAQDPTLLERLQGQAVESPPSRSALRPHRELGAAVLNASTQLLQGCTTEELRLPVTRDAHVVELATIVVACTPEVRRDLTLLPEALEAAQAALVEV